MACTANRTRARDFTVILQRSCRIFLPIVLALLVPVGAATYSGGSGSAGDPYQIETPEDLDMLGSTPDDWGKQFKLTADIDLAAYDEGNFHLIGHWVAGSDPANKPFTGVFDGNDCAILNFHYDGGKQDGIALFPYLGQGEIKNLTLKGTQVISDGFGVGSLVGHLVGGNVTDCHVTGADVTGNTQVGGLVGRVDGSILRCSSRGQVAGAAHVGGLVGDVRQATVARSYSKCSVYGGDNVGGLAGISFDAMGVLDSCYATGRVEGTTFVGGLIGQISQGRVFKCYASGAVSGRQSTGGLVGTIRAMGEVILSFWDKQASGQATSAGGIGKTTAEMRSAATFAGWDFDYTWTICDGVSSPIFLWQIPPADMRCPDGVNWTDFAWFAMQWEHRHCSMVNSYCEWADFDESGAVDALDLSIFADNWLVGTD